MPDSSNSKLDSDVVQKMRIAYRWGTIQDTNDKIHKAKLIGSKYYPKMFASGDTKKKLLTRSRYLLFSLQSNGGISKVSGRNFI